ncbi:MAG: hypothetical protein ABIF92_01365 [archaeon]
MRILSRKAQSEILSKVIVLLILLALSGVAYYWGSGLMEAQGVRSEAEQISSTFLELRQKIIEVANSGNNSARFVDISLDYGTLEIKSGEPCFGAIPGENIIIYSVSSRDMFVNSESWSLADSENRNMLCTAPYENSSSGVLLARSEEIDGKSNNQYALWFRALSETGSSKIFLINLTAGGTDLLFTKGPHQLRVESQGSSRAGIYEYATVLVSEV